MAGRHRLRFTPAVKAALVATVTGLVTGAAVLSAGQGAAAPQHAQEQAAGGAAPYVDTTLQPAFDLVKTAQSTGVKTFTLAFVVSDGQGCVPKWGGQQELGDNPVAKQVDALRAAGGDVRLSFGGASGAELATVCHSPEELTAAYQKAIDAVGAKKVDFDIEGGALGDGAANDRRNAAIKSLQAKNNGLDVSITLPVLPSGLTEPGVALVKSAKDAGVDVGSVNVMAMDYGDAAAPNPDGQMGKYAIDAATATQQQLKGALGVDDEQAWHKVSVTPMIGVNDVTTEVFKQSDAKQVADFAKAKGLAWVGMWSGHRDTPCPGGGVQPTCSGIDQQPNEFATILAGA